MSTLVGTTAGNQYMVCSSRELATTDNGESVLIGFAPYDIEVLSVDFYPAATVAENATNYFRLVLYFGTVNMGTAVGSAGISAGSALSVYSGTAEVDATTLMKATYGTVGTGAACPDGLWVIKYRAD